jgi:hypothetical protein
VNPVTDPARIAKVLRHPSVWPYITDDLTQGEWSPPIDAGRVYLMPDDDSACFVFSHHSGAMAEGHLAALPGSNADALGYQALNWMRENTPYRCLIGFVNARNRRACAYVERLGFVPVMQLPDAALKGGEHMDVIFYTRNL